MEQETHSQQTPAHATASPNKPKKSKGTFLAIIFVAGLILAGVIANRLGWMPELTFSPQSNPTQNQNSQSDTFRYDSKKAINILTRYIKDTIKPEFLTENFDIKQGLSFTNIVDEKSKNVFGAYLDNSNETISFSLSLIENSELPNDFKVFIHPKTTIQDDLNVDIANSLVSTYFLNAFPIENCNTSGTTSYCKTMKEESDGKKEFGVIIGLDSSKSPPVPATTVFNCFTAKYSNFYELVQSCVSP